MKETFWWDSGDRFRKRRRDIEMLAGDTVLSQNYTLCIYCRLGGKESERLGRPIAELYHRNKQAGEKKKSPKLSNTESSQWKSLQKRRERNATKL